jgi:hypothetical protein
MKPPSLMKGGVSKAGSRGRRDLTLKLHNGVRKESCCLADQPTKKGRGSSRFFEVLSRTCRFNSVQLQNTTLI